MHEWLFYNHPLCLAFVHFAEQVVVLFCEAHYPISFSRNRLQFYFKIVLFFDILIGDKLDTWPANRFSKTKCCICFVTHEGYLTLNYICAKQEDLTRLAMFISQFSFFSEIDHQFFLIFCMNVRSYQK